MTRQTWIFASVLSALAIIGIVSLTAWRKGNELTKAQSELAELQKAEETRRAQLEEMKTDLEKKQAQVQELEKARDAATQAQKDLESTMRSALESKDITISELQGNLTVNILDRILFASGEAVIKPEGEKVLAQIAHILADFPNRQIQVIGHTDDVPIRAGSLGCFPTNWELSAGRATAAVRALQEKGGVDPRRLAAVGYGQFHPIADNGSPEGRAKNRRIALVVLPEKVSVSDVAPEAKVPLIHADTPKPIQTNAPAVRLEAPATETNNPALPAEKP